MNNHNDAPDCAGRNGAQDHGKHTPGPWVVDPCWDILGNTDDGNGMVCQITTDAVPRAEADANARLIAAAPDSIATCHAVMAWWEEHKYDTDAYDCGDGYMDEYNRYDVEPEFVTLARAAIAKAEGRSDV